MSNFLDKLGIKYHIERVRYNIGHLLIDQFGTCIDQKTVNEMFYVKNCTDKVLEHLHLDECSFIIIDDDDMSMTYVNLSSESKTRFAVICKNAGEFSSVRLVSKFRMNQLYLMCRCREKISLKELLFIFRFCSIASSIFILAVFFKIFFGIL